MAPLDFVALEDLHNSANNLLHSPMVQQAIFHQIEEKWLDNVLESSLRMLEVCGISKDVLLLGMKSQKATMHPPMINEQKLFLVVDVLREVRMTSICIVESLLSLVSSPWLDKKIRETKVRHIKAFTYDMIYYDAMVLQSENKRSAGVRMAIEDIKVELEFMFRRLIHTRVLLLNILAK
ncbi:hypothetical protein GYH30_017916 [Glycine max]|uniref:Uncharacterized protein n=2 Tax=Glycine subgen. Soja TaxID=1462606 RepID=A0A0R0J1E8_SOYBN|nr:hypothetical protein GYH30_017916 [Glycine max]RZC02228.1 hypothetical protein D0Y65_017396 [Glycine soja]